MGIKVRGRMLAFHRLMIDSQTIEQFVQDLQALGDSKECVPVFLDCTNALDLKQLRTLLWQKGMAVMGVVDGVLNDQAKAEQLAVLPSDGKRLPRLSSTQTKEQNSDKRDTSTDGSTADEPDTNTDAMDMTNKSNPNAALPYGPINAKVHRQMVRSGQSVHHMGGDLIVTAAVNHGSEVATDCSLHLYSKAQGRLIAGATGDESACIFCQVFEPSLVSVAGTYCLKEDLPKELFGKAVQVSLSKDKGLVFEQIG